MTGSAPITATTAYGASSLYLSSQSSAARNASTGSSAISAEGSCCISMSARSQDLQRDHPLVAAPARALVADRKAGRQRHVVPIEHREAKVDLRAEAAEGLAQRRILRV